MGRSKKAMGKKPPKKGTTTGTGNVNTNMGLAEDGTNITLQDVGGRYEVVLPTEWVGRTATLNTATGRWIISPA